jgi:hypothetical protein
MPNDENKYGSGVGHVVLDVLHGPSNEVHSVAVPESTPLPELHDALVTAGYHAGWAPYQGAGVDSFGRPKAGPSKSGVLENDPKFKAAAKAIYDASGRGRNPNEAGTYLDANLDRGPIAVSNTEGHMSLSVPSDASSTLHTHPSHFNGATASPLPSGTDVDTAKKLKRSVYVVSPEGLSVVEGDGKVTNIYNDSGWLTRDNK